MGWKSVLSLTILCGSSIASATDAVVSDCTETGFHAALANVDTSGGGTITFACGTTTIALTSSRQVANNVIIDGADQITLSGSDSTPFFQYFFSSTSILRRITLRQGEYDGNHAIENFGHLTLDRVRLLDNVSGGPALANYGTLTVRDSTFSGNENTANYENGGALFNGNIANIQASTFDGNHAAGSGGAIANEGALSVVNSTFSQNSANSGGGALYQGNASGLSEFRHTTVVGNQAVFGGGLYADGVGSNLTVTASIVSANLGGNCDGVMTSGGYNLSNDNGCGSVFTATGDLLNQTLVMGTLMNNGGVTETLLPQAGNPAIDHVPAVACTLAVDQRSGLRPAGAGCDSGAVETDATLGAIFIDGFETML